MKKQKILESDLFRCGIPNKLLNIRKQDLSHASARCADKAFDYLISGDSVFLCGEASIERDKIAVVVTKRLIAREGIAEAAQLSLYEPTLIDAYAGYVFDESISRAEIWQRYREHKYALLAGMDGTCSSRKLYGPCYSSLLAGRLDKNLATFIATELNTEELHTFYGSDVVRIVEGYYERVVTN